MATNAGLERPAKRRRKSTSEALIALSGDEDDIVDDRDSVLDRAIHVLATEAAALADVTDLYRTNRTAMQSLKEAVSVIVQTQSVGGKLIACGVGKSAYVAMKLVATCKSLGVPASFMHACEAAHGDLGDLRADDVLLFVSFSGKTPELLNLFPHIQESTRIIALSSHCRPQDCPLLADRNDGILLPAPIPETEEFSFGVAAPTTSTTVALAVSDMLALTVAHQIHQSKTKTVFKQNHPGGAIGMNHREIENLKKDDVEFTVIELPSPSISASDDC